MFWRFGFLPGPWFSFKHYIAFRFKGWVLGLRVGEVSGWGLKGFWVSYLDRV